MALGLTPRAVLEKLKALQMVAIHLQVLEIFVTKHRDHRAALNFLKRTMRDHPAGQVIGLLEPLPVTYGQFSRPPQVFQRRL